MSNGERRRREPRRPPDPEHQTRLTGELTEAAVLCGVRRPGAAADVPGEAELAELTRLVETAGARVVDAITQRRAKPDASTYMGKGKVEDLTMLVRAHDANLVVADDDLTPAQGRKLEKAVETRVIDRSQLILDIFARHARSKQARLQVELAQLEYTLPRLKRMWTHLERLGGGIGTNGPGETQIETDRRIIRKKLVDTRRELDQIKARKEREVASRSDFFAVGLVGYTNAGKSTLHSALTGSDVHIEDRLFATLDTKTSLLALPGGGRVLLSDTVGFIDKLPHHLVECFHATLEEARSADLLLHVVDASHPHAGEQLEIVRGVLDHLGLGGVPTIIVFNKCDAPIDPLKLTAMTGDQDETVRISARTGAGIDELRLAVQRCREVGFVRRLLRLPVSEGRWLSRIESLARVHQREFDEEGTAHIDATLPRSLLGQLRRDVPGCECEDA